jgi:hypothetical protein
MSNFQIVNFCREVEYDGVWIPAIKVPSVSQSFKMDGEPGNIFVAIGTEAAGHMMLEHILLARVDPKLALLILLPLECFVTGMKRFIADHCERDVIHFGSVTEKGSIFLYPEA